MALVRIDGINFTYAGAKKSALINASLEINEGEYVLLTGASGCGKTTLIRQIKPELTPAGARQGSIAYDGTAIEKLVTASIFLATATSHVIYLFGSGQQKASRST